MNNKKAKISRVKLEKQEEGAEIRIGPMQELIYQNKYKWKCNGCNEVYGYRETAKNCADLHEGINYHLRNEKMQRGEKFRIRHLKYGWCDAEALDDSYLEFGTYITDIILTKKIK